MALPEGQIREEEDQPFSWEGTDWEAICKEAEWISEAEVACLDNQDEWLAALRAAERPPEEEENSLIGIPDDKWGEAVHAVVVCKPGMSVSADELIAHTRTKIAGYKVPRSVEFMAEALPKSGAGKILKRDLREKYWVGKSRNVN